MLKYALALCFCGVVLPTLSAQDFTIHALQEEKTMTPLCAELNKIIAAYPNGFAGLKGAAIKKNQYACTIQLPGAVETMLMEKMDEDFNTQLVYRALYSKEMSWKEASDKVYEIGEDIGGCVKAGAGRFIHSINDTKNKQLSIFLPHQPEGGYETLAIKLMLIKEQREENSYGIIELIVGPRD